MREIYERKSRDTKRTLPIFWALGIIKALRDDRSASPVQKRLLTEAYEKISGALDDLAAHRERERDGGGKMTGDSNERSGQ